MSTHYPPILDTFSTQEFLFLALHPPYQAIARIIHLRATTELDKVRRGEPSPYTLEQLVAERDRARALIKNE